VFQGFGAFADYALPDPLSIKQLKRFEEVGR
jgi:hypothetical protein